MDKGKQSAFTLAEVLITLGIIGIVAAMTLPTLVQKHQKKVIATQLKTSYTQIMQIFERAKADYDDPKYWIEPFEMGNQQAYDDNLEKFLNTYFLPYVHGKYVKGTAKDIGYADFTGTLSDPNAKTVTWKTQFIKLSNGSVIRIGLNNNEIVFRDLLMYVDVNGMKKPNIQGKDIFLIVFGFNTGKVYFYGKENSREKLINDHCGKTAHGDQMCGQLVMLDGWEIKDDYPW